MRDCVKSTSVKVEVGNTSTAEVNMLSQLNGQQTFSQYHQNNNRIGIVSITALVSPRVEVLNTFINEISTVLKELFRAKEIEDVH